MRAKEIRQQKINERIRKAQKLTPGQRIEEAVLLSELCLELKKGLHERNLRKTHLSP